ncbi:hypothetical protein [Flavobacterium sp. TAB 87]|uniref:hypothetical protein n=1 Tax=Flavobacterium sp. TAB 87 TaxID=1729581 RepID=UPI00076D3A99|nr:hypothetical protein [Flavobacterium sp. TAB 87]KVV15326.1 hypothetical protein AP058_00992 [Flavobacterium sp. TAB 87]
MKLRNLFILFFALLFSNLISAQYGNGYGNGYGNNGYGNNGYGRNRQMGGMSDMGQQQQSKPKEIPVDVTAGEIMERMTPVLTLDALQEVAIKNVLIESLNLQGILIKNESLSQEAKMDEFKSLSENTNKQINNYLNPDQQEKYKIYLEDNAKPRKSKKKKKKE